MADIVKHFLMLAVLQSTLNGNAQCFEQLDGRGLFFFSPVKTKLTLYKPLKGKEWGDSTIRNCAGYGPVIHRRVAPGYVLQANTPIYASHSGILRIFTTGGNDEPNDACWIDGEDFSTAYYHVYFTVSSNKYVYAGQRIGTVIPRKDTTFFYYGIRQAKPVQPIMKRVGLPVKGEKDCSCYIDPIFPEYFVNPTDWHLHWEYNETEPSTTIKVNISPSWVGKWSFDNGKTWLSGGEAVSGLPQKYYKIIFRDRSEWGAPIPIEINSSDAKNDFEFNVQYTKELSYNESVKTNSSFIDSGEIYNIIDSVKKESYDSSYNNLKRVIYRTFQDSLTSKISKIELEQQKTQNYNKALFIIMPLALLLSIALVIAYFQYKRLKKEKKQIVELQKELHHQVRNNLGIISGLIDASVDSKSNDISLKDLESRIQSISFIHEQLYQKEDITKINLQEFIETLCSNLSKTYQTTNKIFFNINAHLLIETKLATQLALTLSELITNCIKHGGVNLNELAISVSAKKLKNDKISISVSDNGKGFPENFEHPQKGSYGINMIKGLLKQMNGTVIFKNNNGSFSEIIF
ncbi:MAG: ATP-binding protein [Chitinophagaceae bacterium]|nr:ATP-binding protein [Chitinophagaceae bacterium]